MPHSSMIVALAIMLLVAALSVVARRLHVPSPILMLLAGTALAFTPRLPPVQIDPQFVLLLLLPPLLYTSGVGMSWRGFRTNLRPILLLAIGCVLFTAAVVAAAVHGLLGVSWPVGFVLGAIVSPPDAVAPMAVLRAVHLPRRLVTVLEGESLVNDATALVTLGFALAAVGSRPFSLSAAVVQFCAIAIAEIGFGIAVACVMLRLRHWLRDARAEVLLALTTPFIAFWPPHAAGGSGVIACVAAGLYVSWNGRTLIRPATRLQGYFIWDLVVWAVEALVFLLAGLQARAVVGALTGDGWQRTLWAALLTCAVVILIRFVWVYPATYLPRLLIPAVRKADPSPDWRQPFLIAFTGLRGAVSLAAALLIPPLVDGVAFPDRDLVLVSTYGVIIVTLIGLGGSLPVLVRALGLDHRGAREAERHKQAERQVRLIAIDEVLARLTAVAEAGESQPRAPDLRAAELRRRHEDRRAYYARAAAGAPMPLSATSQELQLLEVEREAVAKAYAENRLTDEARRRIERELDLEDARIRHALESSGLG